MNGPAANGMNGPVLLTGFEPFGGHPVNPTAELMRRLDGVEGVVTGILPVEYGAAAARFAALLEQHRPAAAIAFGLAFKTDYILIERLAWNRDESPQPDNAGVVRDDVPIVPDGPTAYGSGIPVPALLQALAMAGLPVTFSDHAGGFVCNHLYYSARHFIVTQGLDVPMVFLHAPPLPEQVAGQSGRTGLPLDRLELGAHAAVALVRRALGGFRPAVV